MILISDLRGVIFDVDDTLLSNHPAGSAMGLHESERKHVVVFEDDPRGIMSAKAADIFTCAITTRFKRKDLEALEIAPDLIADSYAEFAELLGLK